MCQMCQICQFCQMSLGFASSFLSPYFICNSDYCDYQSNHIFRGRARIEHDRVRLHAKYARLFLISKFWESIGLQ